MDQGLRELAALPGAVHNSNSSSSGIQCTFLASTGTRHACGADMHADKMPIHIKYFCSFKIKVEWKQDMMTHTDSPSTPEVEAKDQEFKFYIL